LNLESSKLFYKSNKKYQDLRGSESRQTIPIEYNKLKQNRKKQTLEEQELQQNPEVRMGSPDGLSYPVPFIAPFLMT